MIVTVRMPKSGKALLKELLGTQHWTKQQTERALSLHSNTDSQTHLVCVGWDK